MEKIKYSDKLKDPRWKRKRVEILERADYKCEACEKEDEPLQIHHGYYERNLEPWDYDEDTLHCLCEECHSMAELMREIIYKEIGRINPSHYKNVLSEVLKIKKEAVNECINKDVLA